LTEETARRKVEPGKSGLREDFIDRVNWVNIGLMLLACVAAVLAPFHVFLFSYAVLGPLHYLTEISWLHDRHFFTARQERRRAWLLLVAATATVMTLGYVSSEILKHPVAPTVEIGMFWLVFVGAAVALYVRHPINGVAIMAVAILAVVIFSAHREYGILAYLLITIIHVFVFTGCFILVGAAKSHSRSGYLSFAVFVGCAVAAFLVPVPARVPGGQVRVIYAAFEQLNGVLLQLFGRPASSTYEAGGIGIMRFIAFAYSYHYLNWFSKTSIIRWHEVTHLRSAAIIVAWLTGIGIYLHSYRIGFAVFYLLSATHVMLEFPLNHQSFVGLAHLFARGSRRTADAV
jgi:hypothetical protein